MENSFSLNQSPEKIIEMIDHLDLEIQGFGVTYLSKLVRFAFPSSAGAIDTRLVRIFGYGDSQFESYRWITLKVTQSYNSRWYISKKQFGWPKEYGEWIKVLSFIAKMLNEKQIECPHPDSFIEAGLRRKGEWLCADVEMALFSYASQKLKNNIVVKGKYKNELKQIKNKIKKELSIKYNEKYVQNVVKG